LIEALTYGREWQLGYDKLPPLPWWLVEIVYRTIGIDAAYYALAQFAVVLAFIAVWLTARELVGATAALVAVLILDGLHYFHFTRREVQSRRHPTAALGVRRLRLSRRLAPRPHGPLAAARRHRRACLVGEIFCGRAGGAACLVPAHRPGRAARARYARPLRRARAHPPH